MLHRVFENGVEVESYDDGVDPISEQSFQVSRTALDSLDSTLQDPAINSISEIKTALKDFVADIKSS